MPHLEQSFGHFQRLLRSFNFNPARVPTRLELKHTYLQQVKKYHPDRNASKDAASHFVQVKNTYNELEGYINDPVFLNEYRHYMASSDRPSAREPSFSSGPARRGQYDPLRPDDAARHSYDQAGHKYRSHHQYYSASPFEDLNDFYSTQNSQRPSSYDSRMKYFWGSYGYSFPPFSSASGRANSGYYEGRWYDSSPNADAMPPPIGSPYTFVNLLGLFTLLIPALYICGTIWRSRRRAFSSLDDTRTLVALEMKYQFLDDLKKGESSSPLRPPTSPLLRSLSVPLHQYSPKDVPLSLSQRLANDPIKRKDPTHEEYVRGLFAETASKSSSSSDGRTEIKEDRHYYYHHKDLTNVLHRAVIAHDFDETLRLLLDGCHPSFPDRKRRTPLHYAAYSGQLDLCRLLLIFNADPLARDAFHESPLDAARIAGRSDVEALLFFAVTGNYALATELVRLRDAKESYIEWFRMVDSASVVPFGVPEDIRLQLRKMRGRDLENDADRRKLSPPG